jgi:hypothetical protein
VWQQESPMCRRSSRDGGVEVRSLVYTNCVIALGNHVI